MTSTARSEDARSFYQLRLALMHQVGFSISFAFLLGVVVVRGLVGGSIAAELASPSRWFHIIVTLATATMWRTLRRRRLEFSSLDRIDGVGVLLLSVFLNLNAGLFEIRTVSVFNLVLTTGLAAVLRAVVVPSTPRRTFVFSAVGSAFAIAVFFASLHPGWPVKQTMPDWPLGFQLISLVLWLAALSSTAVVASRVIYNLRREVHVAKKLGQYVLGEKIGEGGMGVVYRATHAMLRRDTAIKLLLPDRVDATSVRRFEREVVATARLQHPNTIAVYDYGHTPEGVFYYAMEYLDGVTVAELVDREGPLPPARVVWLLAQVCASLDEAHSVGLVHRDIKPANIMVVGHPAAFDLVKVLDFGLVRNIAAGDATESAASPMAKAITGTPLYMAPESITQPDGAEPRSDLYAVAAVGYFMLSGKHVFDAPTVVEVCAAHLREAPATIKTRSDVDVPADLEALIMRGLSKAPGDRPPNAAAFRTALLACKVPAWGEDEARAWWRTKGERLARPARLPRDLANAPTISVVIPPPAG